MGILLVQFWMCFLPRVRRVCEHSNSLLFFCNTQQQQQPNSEREVRIHRLSSVLPQARNIRILQCWFVDSCRINLQIPSTVPFWWFSCPSIFKMICTRTECGVSHSLEMVSLSMLEKPLWEKHAVQLWWFLPQKDTAPFSLLVPQQLFRTGFVIPTW